MKKSILFLVFVMILTMMVPTQGITMPQSKSAEMPASNDINGTYVISVKTGDEWKEIGALSFGKNPSTEKIDVGGYFIGDSPIIKVSQNGGGSAYLDAVLLDGIPGVKANNEVGKLLAKLSKEDLDITQVGEEGVMLEFSNPNKNSILTVVGRIEPIVIGKEPLQFPAENNYKSKEEVENFYSYTVGSNLGTVKVDGVLGEVFGKDPFVKEYSVPGSGHPAGDTYLWVMNDDENLYVTMDVTPDNTFDGDKDYAKVYVNTDEGIKEFRVSVPETIWGNTAFIYTDKVGYEHKVYEFSIPLNKINVNKGEEINIAFVVYGTVGLTVAYQKPSLAYDPKNQVYISVFEHIKIVQEDSDNFFVTEIYADVISSEGDVIVNDYPLVEYNKESLNSRYQFTPSIEYNYAKETFLLTWNQCDNDIFAKYIYINNDYSMSIGNTIIVSQYDGEHKKRKPSAAYDSINDRFLVVWAQNNDDNGYDIYGRILSEANLIGDNDIEIGTDTNDQECPKVSYSLEHKKFLVTWYGWYDYQETYVDAQFVGDNGEVKESDKIRISNVGYWSNVSYNNHNSNKSFLVTWEEDSEIYGKYVSLLESGISLADNIKITPDDYYFGSYPSSYYDGNNSMLCVWSSAPGDGDSCVRLNYVDNLGNVGVPFFDKSDEPDSIESYESPIALTGNFNGQFLIAYAIKGRNDIGYRFIGENTEFKAHIKFEPTSYTVQEGGDEDVTVKFYSGMDMEPEDVTDKVIYEYNSAYVNVDNTGKITGVKSINSTTIKAYYMPPMEADFSQEVIDISSFPYFAEATVTVTHKLGEPSLSFDKDTYTVEIEGSPYQTTVNYFDGLANHPNITESVEMFYVGDPNIATITSGGAITALAVGKTTISAIYLDCTANAYLIVNEKTTHPPSGGGSSATIRMPIGQILADNKVIKTLYKEDVKVKNNTYIFTADKASESAKLWIDSRFYEELADDYPNRVIKFNWNKGTYTLPLNCDEVLNEIDSSAKKVSILMEKVEDDEIIKVAEESAEKIGAEIISDLIKFSVFVEKTKGNKDIESLDFYAERTINQLEEISENISTAMKFIENKKTLTFAPSVFDDNFVIVKYRGNGIFTVIKNPQTFNDIGSHWAKISIEKLATRNIAFGRQNNNFVPDDFITRAEFAVMITRALGLTEEEGSSNFKDVSNEWFAEDISTVFEIGLIKGRNDGNFYPNEKILRKDIAVIMYNALKFAENEAKIADIEKILSMFKDNDSIDNYAKESVAVCADAGIIMGRDTKNFDPDENATRGEASAIIERMLKHLEFMD